MLYEEGRLKLRKFKENKLTIVDVQAENNLEQQK
jgi:hypothetical protein